MIIDLNEDDIDNKNKNKNKNKNEGEGGDVNESTIYHMLRTFFDIFKKLTSLGIPMALSFTFSFEVFISVFLLKYLSNSSDETAAAALVSVFMNTVMILAVSPLISESILLNNMRGELDKINENDENSNITEEIRWRKEAISSVNANALLISAVLIPPTFLTLYFSENILVSVFRQTPSVAKIAGEFLQTYSYIVPVIFARFDFEQIMFGFEETTKALFLSLPNLAIGGILSWLLGFGRKIGSLEIPKLGPKGVAIGFMVESALTALCYGLYVRFSKKTSEFEFFTGMLQKIKNNLPVLKKMLPLGGTISMTMAMELASMLSVGIFSGLVGVEEQAAMTYNLQYIYFVSILSIALSLSSTQMMSKVLGADKYLEANQVAKYGLLTNLIYITPIPLLFTIYPKALIWISGGASENISKILESLTRIMGAAFIIDNGIRYYTLSISRTGKRKWVANVITLAGLGKGIILSGTLGLKTSLGINGVAIGFLIGTSVAASGLIINGIKQLRDNEIKANVPKPLCSNTWCCVFAKNNKLKLKHEPQSTQPLLQGDQGQEVIEKNLK